MKKSLFALLLLIAVASQAAPDTTIMEKRINSLELKIKNSNDSLKRELQYYKMKDDYYSTALSDQSTRFTTIIGIIIGLAGLLSFSWYNVLLSRIDDSKSYINHSNKALNDTFNSLINKALNGIQKTENQILDTHSSAFDSIAKTFVVEEIELSSEQEVMRPYLKYINQFLYSSQALSYRIMYLNENNNESVDKALKLIELCEVAIKKLEPLYIACGRKFPVSLSTFGIARDYFEVQTDKNLRKELNVPLVKINILYKELINSGL